MHFLFPDRTAHPLRSCLSMSGLPGWEIALLQLCFLLTPAQSLRSGVRCTAAARPASRSCLSAAVSGHEVGSERDHHRRRRSGGAALVPARLSIQYMISFPFSRCAPRLLHLRNGYFRLIFIAHSTWDRCTTAFSPRFLFRTPRSSRAYRLLPPVSGAHCDRAHRLPIRCFRTICS